MNTNTYKTYQVRTRFSLNLGEGAKAVSLNVSPGDLLQFDGVSVSVRGVSGVAPTLHAVIRLGWVTEVHTAESAAGVSAPAAPSVSAIAQPAQQAAPQDIAVAPSAGSGRRVVSSEEYGREVTASRMARAGVASTNNEALITSSTSAQQRRSVVPHEAQVKVASATQQPSAPREVQYMQPATRVRRQVEVQDSEEVSVGSGRSRATSTQSANLLTGSDSTGTSDAEVGTASRSAKKATISKGPIEKQEVAGVIKGRRATPLNFADDMTKVSAMQASSDPSPIHSGEDPLVGKVRKTAATTSNGGEVTVGVTVSSQGDMTVPVATTSASGPDIIMPKAAVISADNDPLYDPANYLGLADSAKAPPAARVVESSAPEATIPGANTDSVDGLDFGEQNTLGAEREMVDHEGKVVKIAAKATTVLDDADTASASEEDYSNMNDGLEAGTTGFAAPPSDEVVPSDYLDTLKVGGLLWAKSPHTAKIAFIKGKKTAKGYTGGCMNLSILRLIASQSGLPKSVTDSVAERLAELKG